MDRRGKRMNWLRRRHPFVSIVLLLTILKISTVSPSDDQHEAQKILNGDGEGPESYQAVSKATNQSLLWGTYRPNLYFGLKPRQPNSLMTGMIWFGTDDYSSFARSRHTCEQGDELGGYGYDKHDGRNFASHFLRDELNNLDLKIQFLKTPGGDHGGSWGMRIIGDSLDTSKPSRISLINYFGLDGLGTFQLDSNEDEEGIDDPVITLTGSSTQLGDFKIRIQDSPTNPPIHQGRHSEDFGDKLKNTQFLGSQVPSGSVWKAREYIIHAITQAAEPLLEKYTRENPPDPAILYSLPNDISYGSNLYAFQRTYESPFELDIYFDGDGAPKLDSPSLSAGITAASNAFDERFKRTFPKIFSSPDYTTEHHQMAREMVSSMIGGIGYFYGSSIVDRNFAHDYDDDGILLTGNSDESDDTQNRKKSPQLTDDRELFTATPSRSFFPRGFYWDEGFHLALIGSWDNDLSLEILQSWIQLIDRDGWVGREQILGEEARSKVPTEFQVQYSNHANPPTLTMAVTSYIKRLKRYQGSNVLTDSQLGLDRSSSQQVFSSSPDSSDVPISDRFLADTELAKSFLLSIYPKLKLHYEWFRETQLGQIRQWGRNARSKTEGYRWRGRTESHVLTSGIDDYPRGAPHPGELHLDLISWMGFFTRTMKSIAEFVGESEDAAEYDKIYSAILGNIDDIHWCEEKKMYCDVSVNEDGLIPKDSNHLGDVLRDLKDPEGVWSDFGIRSLAKNDEYFGTNENYWRGPIWMPMNYMALNALYSIYAKEEGPFQKEASEIYNQLKSNVVNNVFEEWKRTGFTWEQYDALHGKGKRSKPFTGWTSLVAMIMADEYDM